MLLFLVLSNFYEILLLLYNPGQGIWSGLEKSSKIRQGEESLISTFACCLAIAAGRNAGHWGMSPPYFDIFLIFLNYLRS